MDSAQLLAQTTAKNADLGAIRGQVDNALSAADDAVLAARDAVLNVKGNAQARLLAETTFTRVWPRIQAKLVAATDGMSAVQIAVEELQGADDAVRPLLAQEVVDYLSASRGLREDSITQHVLVPLSADLSNALDARARDQREAAIVRHNIAQAEQGTAHYVGGQE